LSCELTTQALPPACSAVGLPRMEGVAEKTIRDVASMSTDHKITQISTEPFFQKERFTKRNIRNEDY